jgi:prophage regulatory protein
MQTQGAKPKHRPAYRPHRSDLERHQGDAPRVPAPLPRYLRMAQLVPGLVPVSPATIWRWSKDGRFPAPIKLAERVTVWKLEEVLAWLEDRQAGSV